MVDVHKTDVLSAASRTKRRRCTYGAGAAEAVPRLLALTRHTLATGIGLPITGVGVAGRAAVHSAQQGAQVTNGHLLYEGGPVFPKIPPLKYLGGRRGETNKVRINKC